MYNIASLSQSSIRNLNALQSRGVNHGRVFSVAMAYTVNRTLGLPSVPVEDVAGYYRMHFAVEVREVLSKINELIPFDMRSTEDDVKGLLQFRMNMVSLKNYPLAMNKETGLVDFFTLSSCFPNEVLDLIRDDSAKICHLVTQLSPIYEELLKASKVQMDLPIDNGLGEKLPA